MPWLKLLEAYKLSQKKLLKPISKASSRLRVRLKSVKLKLMIKSIAKLSILKKSLKLSISGSKTFRQNLIISSYNLNRMQLRTRSILNPALKSSYPPLFHQSAATTNHRSRLSTPRSPRSSLRLINSRPQPPSSLLAISVEVTVASSSSSQQAEAQKGLQISQDWKKDRMRILRAHRWTLRMMGCL